MKTITFDSATAKVDFRGKDANCEYVAFLKLKASENTNGSVTLMPVFQNPVTGEICDSFDTYPEYIKYILEAQTLKIHYNAIDGEAMLWYETVNQNCGLTTEDVICNIHIDDDIFSHLIVCTSEMFNAHMIKEDK